MPPLRSRRLLVAVALFAAACSSTAPTSPTPSTAPQGGADPSVGRGGDLVVYSGRSEELVAPLIERFRASTGRDVRVKYAGTAELAATILEEGENSPADAFFAQDAGALGAVAGAGMALELPGSILDRVDARYRSPAGSWVGVSGRVRVAAYDSRDLEPGDLPSSIFGFTEPAWRGRIGWAPTNSSFHSFVSALRVVHGDGVARRWLEGMRANEPRAYEGNSQALQAVAAEEIDVALVNHYYLMRQLAEAGSAFPVRNHFFANGDVGSLVNVAGALVLRTSDRREGALDFIAFLLAEESQRYFATETFEYSLVETVPAPEGLVPLAELDPPNIDLSDLADLAGTLELLRETGIL